MKTIEVKKDDQIYYATADPIRTGNDPLVPEGKIMYTAYIGEEPPNALVLGEQLMNSEGLVRRFSDETIALKEAEEEIMRRL